MFKYYRNTMRKTALLIMSLLMGASVSLMAQVKGQELKVMSFNILHGATMKGDFDLDLIADLILEHQPDVVALQEVDFKTGRAKGMDLVTELALRTKMAGLFGEAMPFDGGGYGVGVLSRFPFVRTQNYPLPHTAGNEPRTALEVVLKLDGGHELRMIATHLDHKSEGVDRLAQAQYINEYLLQSGEACILAGDLNATPGSPAINLLEQEWRGSYAKAAPMPTYPSSAKKSKTQSDPVKIDYVMYHPQNAWQVIGREVICETMATDHCVYLAKLKYTGEKQ